MRRLPIVLIAAIVLSLGCTRDFAEPRSFSCPEVPVGDFRNVSAVLEKRCGSLDCHGTLARPLRVMGSTGLRLFTPEEYDEPLLAEEAGGLPGGTKATTNEELEQNRLSLCGLEPERTEEVLAGDLDPVELILIRKPTMRERHKGSLVLLKGGAGESCLTSWLTGQVLVADCVTEVQTP